MLQHASSLSYSIKRSLGAENAEIKAKTNRQVRQDHRERFENRSIDRLGRFHYAMQEKKGSEMDTVLSINLIVTNPKVRGGRPCIVGTGFRVMDVVIAERFHHMTADEIAAGYDVPLAGVHAAFAYYYEHRQDVDEDIRQQIAKGREAQEKNLGNDRTSLLP